MRKKDANRRVTFTGMDILHIQAEKVIESWPCFDRRAIEQQLSAPTQPGDA